jgi:hypothetical protein
MSVCNIPSHTAKCSLYAPNNSSTVTTDLVSLEGVSAGCDRRVIITQKTKHLTRLSQPADTPSSETRSVVTVELLFGEYSEHLAVCEGILQTDIN